MIIYNDASALVALYYEEDIHHKQAVKLAEEYHKEPFMISNFTFAEAVTILSQRAGKEVAIKVGDFLKDNYLWVDIDKNIEDLAWAIFKEQKDKNVSLADCTTIALYQKAVFDQCFTFDQHFKMNKIPVLS